VNGEPLVVPATELNAALLQAAVTFGLALLCAFLYYRYRKPYFEWWAVAWLLYLLRLAAITTFLVTSNRVWLYWHQVITGWTGLALLWAALLFSRQVKWRAAYGWILLFPPVWSFIAIYRLQNFFLAAGPAVLFLSLVTLWTSWIFFEYWRRVRSTGAAHLAVALFLWGLHHLDYPFLRARGAWVPWGYYLDILFTLATGAGIVVLVLDDLRRGLGALQALSGDVMARWGPGQDSIALLLERPLSLPAARGAAIYTVEGGAATLVRGSGVCAAWDGVPPVGAAARAIVQAVARQRPEFVHGWADPAPGRAAFAYAAVLPIPRGGAPAEALVIVGDARDPFTALDDQFLLTLGRQIGAALDAGELSRRLAARTAELQRLSVRMIQQHEEERRRVSLELHDETAQVFAAVRLQLGFLREQVDARLAGEFDRLEKLVDTGIKGIRAVTQDLRPSLLDDLGLLPALRSLAADFAERSGIALTLRAPDQLPALPRAADLALFRALQEALSNVARHSGARAVAITIGVEEDGVAMNVSDDGKGFSAPVDPERLEATGHLGLAGMQERLVVVGGSAEVENAPGGGARLAIWVPLEAEAAS